MRLPFPASPLLRLVAIGLGLLASICTPGLGRTEAQAQTRPSQGPAIALFDVDATPPIDSWMAYDPVTNRWDLGLRARGVILFGTDKPVVLCALDWIGIGNGGQDLFKATLARAAGTTPDHVSVHSLHQHDAPDCDFTAEEILKKAGLTPRQYEGTHQRAVLAALETEIGKSLQRVQPLTHVGFGRGRVHEVASNRRLLGPDGKSKATRWTATKDPELRNAPEGLIDPEVALVSLWNGDKPLAVLSYYAVHPQSYYRTGIPNPDFPGVARFLRQMEMPAALHVHFNGAGGNLGAGKYNDGSPENRLRLAQRLADGMRRAWDGTRKETLTRDTMRWTALPLALPPAKHLNEAQLEAQLKAREASFIAYGGAAKLAWLRRCAAGGTVDAACLALGSGRILHMPGELFVEYQLAARSMRPDAFVAMAAYGDYAPGYIGTTIAYAEGGYETSPAASNVDPSVEPILMDAMKRLLE